MTVIVTLVGVVLLVCAAGLLLMAAVVAGADAYVGWRSIMREGLQRDPVARHFYGSYESPFPWHVREVEEKDRVA